MKHSHLASGQRLGVAAVFIIIVIILIVAVASIGAFYVLSSGSSTSSTSKTTASSSSPSSETSATSMTASSSTVMVTSSSTGSSSLEKYSGTFNFSLPLGPSGERVFSNDTVQTYGTTQVGSGSFSFFINPAADNLSGTGSGHGTITLTTTGFCSGSATLQYTFELSATKILGNLTIFDGTASAMNVTIPLTCTGPMNGVNTATNNPASFLPTYPNEISVASVPANVDMHLGGNISYGFDIVETS